MYKFNLMNQSETGQVNLQQQLHCQINVAIFWHKNKKCRQVNDCSSFPSNYGISCLILTRQLKQTKETVEIRPIKIITIVTIRKRDSIASITPSSEPTSILVTFCPHKQRGRSLTVKAVCGGTLGWKDPPFNSILALPGATHQDPTHNEIINEIINYILKHYPLDTSLKKDIITNSKTIQSLCFKINELITIYLSRSKSATGK